jgi:tetratricopeptide (TPR) repeat protein
LLYELDQLAKRTGASPAERVARLEQHLELVERRDDLYVEYTALYNQLGRPEKALELLLSHRFHPWEGGEGLVAEQYDMAHFMLGRRALETGDPATALQHFESARHYPENLGVARFRAMPEAHLRYYAGLAEAALGRAADAAATWRHVAGAQSALPFEEYYRAVALDKLGDAAGCREKLEAMLGRAEKQRDANVTTGFFENYVANFLLFEDDLATLNRIACAYEAGLAHLGLGRITEARRAFEEVLALDANHLGAREELARVPVS